MLNRCALLALLLASPALGQDEAAPEDLPVTRSADEAVPDLPLVEAQGDPVADLIAMTANPNLPEEQAQRRFEELVARGESTLPTLARVFGDPRSSDNEVWVSARAMGRIGGDGATRTLVDGLRNPRIINRLGAASGLTAIKSRDSVAALEGALFDKAMTVRSAAADALGVIGMRQSHEALLKALDLPGNFHNGQSLFVRYHIVQALGDVGSIGSLDRLVGLLGEQDEQIRLLAVRGLTQITGRSFRSQDTGRDVPPTTDEIEGWKNWWAKRQAADRVEQRVIEHDD